MKSHEVARKLHMFFRPNEPMKRMEKSFDMTMKCIVIPIVCAICLGILYMLGIYAFQNLGEVGKALMGCAALLAVFVIVMAFWEHIVVRVVAKGIVSLAMVSFVAYVIWAILTVVGEQF